MAVQEIRWSKLLRLSARLKYWISANTGIQVVDKPGNKEYFEINAFNSREDLAEGHILIPIDKIPELVNALNRIHFEHRNDT